MNKLNKLAKGLFLLLRKPYLINTILNYNQLNEATFYSEFPRSNPRKQISLNSIYKLEKSISVSPFSFLSGSSLITDFILLKLVCIRTKAKDYLEIGTWRGESVANVAEIVDNCFTLNLSDKELREFNLPENYIESHRFFSSKKQNVTHLFGNSKFYQFEKLERKFDVIFIDGDHHTEAVEYDTKRLYPFLKDSDSIIVWHDAKSDTETIRYEVLLGIYRGIPTDKHKFIYLVENTMCAVYIPEELEYSTLQIYSKPNKFFSIEIKKIDLD